MLKGVFNDKNGKLSMKRVLGALTVLVALLMGVLMFFSQLGENVSDTLILGLVGLGLAAVAVGVFENKK